MPEYRVVFGAYVRMYANDRLYAETDDMAYQRAIEEFQHRGCDLHWLDPDYGNLALPSIVSVERDDPPGEVAVHHDFPITPADARQYARRKNYSQH